MLRLRWMTPLVLAACFPSMSVDTAGLHDDPPVPEEAAEHGGDMHIHSARALLTTLPVREHAPRVGYGREQFGPVWADADRNGCETREDVLRRDLTDVTLKPGARECVVVSGILLDPYTGTRFRFEKGGGGSQVDVDHVVALGNAWDTGAAQWPFRKRVALANDPLNLLAAQAAANRAKGDSDAAQWLPPDPRAHCMYVARQVAVKAKYGLSVTSAEQEAMARVLADCPEEPAPVGEAPTLAPISPPEPAPSKTHERPKAPEVHRETRPAPNKPTPAATKPQAKAPDPNYGSCKQAKANHAGPYVRGRDPEYAYYRDGDDDGIVCE